MVRITIVTPSFNQAKYLEDTIQSVLTQNYHDLEYMIFDGGSNDNSVEIISKYESTLSYWQSCPDGGQTKALIEGFSKATGEILCWLNSDDTLEAGTLGRVSEYFEDHPETQVVYGDAKWIDETGSLIRTKKEHGFKQFIWLNDHNYLPQPSTFFTKTLYTQVGGLDATFNLAMDADLWFRFSQVATIQHVPEIWSSMRVHKEQKMHVQKVAAKVEDHRIRSTYINSQSIVAQWGCRLIARSWRLTLKLFRGAYW